MWKTGFLVKRAELKTKDLSVTEKKKIVVGLDYLGSVKRRCKGYRRQFPLMKGKFIGLIHIAAKLDRRNLLALSPVNWTNAQKKDCLRANTVWCCYLLLNEQSSVRLDDRAHYLLTMAHETKTQGATLPGECGHTASIQMDALFFFFFILTAV